jgi:hypothetical protein
MSSLVEFLTGNEKKKIRKLIFECRKSMGFLPHAHYPMWHFVHGWSFLVDMERIDEREYLEYLTNLKRYQELYGAWRASFPVGFGVNEETYMFTLPDRTRVDIDEYMKSIGKPCPKWEDIIGGYKSPPIMLLL